MPTTLPQTFEEFLSSQGVRIPIVGFLINLMLAALLATVLGWVYVRYGSSLSNRKTFSRNFVLMAMTTTVIITIVKSSLALSLGLVGALSIVRFRAAIKEPEELCYLFLTIAIGLGLGADQREIVVAAFVVIVALVWLRQLMFKSTDSPNLLLTIASAGAQPVQLTRIVEVLNQHCAEVNLKRFDESNGHAEARFLVTYQSFPQLEASRESLRALGDSVRVSYLDSRGIE